MKAIVLLFALIYGASTFAEVIREDSFNTDLRIKPTKIKCTLFGNVKMKVKGLEGNLGKGFLKAQRLEGKCKKNLATIKDQISSRNNTVAAEVNVVTTRRKREVFRHDHDFPRGGHYGRYGYKTNEKYGYGYGRGYSYTECYTEDVTELKAKLPNILVNDEQIVLKRTSVKTVSVTFGYCR